MKALAVRGVIAIGILLVGVSAAEAQGSRSRRIAQDLAIFQQRRTEHRERYVSAMEQLARQEADQGRTAEAARLRELTRPIDSETIRFAPLPQNVRPEIPADTPPEDRFREAQVRKHQEDYAKALYQLSRQALYAGHLGFAYDLVRETVVHEPDHAPARKILGFVRQGDEWLSPFEAARKRLNQVWHPQYGWIPERDIPRYESGERPYKDGRWYPAAKVAELRRDFNNAWEVRTEHFAVKTNHSLEKGVELASQLEDFHGLCRQTLAGFFFNPDQLRLMFDGKGESRLRKFDPLKVHYYSTRDEYLKVLKQWTDQPIEITKGMYFPSQNTAYFFFDPNESNESTLFHEATHLLLSGSRPQTGFIGQKAHFWLVEGIACYMESFQRKDGELTVGNPANERIQAAQYHLTRDQYYVPLREFSAMGMQAFQTAPEIRKNYSQAAALTHFFLHYDNGKYRDALIEHLSQIYSPQVKVRNDPQTLSDLLEVAEEQLDREYVEYLRTLDTRTQENPGAPQGPRSRGPMNFSGAR